MDVAAFTSVRLAGISLARLHRHELVESVFSRMANRRGGWVVTANLDYLRRCTVDPEFRQLIESADLIVADGMPLLWAASLQGTPLPDRVAGSDLVWLLAQRAARDGRSIYLLGGAPGTAEGAAIELTRRCPGLRIAGLSSPRLPERPTSKELVPIASELREKQPDLVYIALGMPKGEFLIHELRATLPNAWWIGIGISLSFITGAVRRAPQWMQRSGLEWIHRLWQEPSRLARRYLRDDLPFAFRLFALALEARGAHQSGNR